LNAQHIMTPALLVDLDSMESNLKRMAGFFAGKPCGLRPHFKNHKVPALAWKQLRSGSIGITCATLREAEILVHNGITNILVANEIAGDLKAEFVADLSKRATVVVAVDSASGVRDLARAQRNRKSEIEVVVDLDIGLHRCGVQPYDEAIQLTRLVVGQGLKFRGIMGYDGNFQVAPPSPTRDELVRQGSKALVGTAALIEAEGIPVSIVSTGGTGTYSVSGDYPGITDIQAGSYLLMDTIYIQRGSSFIRSLTILATVISIRGSAHAVIDCGLKAMSGERGWPRLKGLPDVRVVELHAEHGILEIQSESATTLEVGQKIELWVQYGDATLNLHSCLHGVRNGHLEEVFQIEH